MYMWYSVVVWKVELEPIREWLQTLDKPSKEQVAAAIMLLQREGPDLKRPLVGKIVTSRYRNMKELRPWLRGQERDSDTVHVRPTAQRHPSRRWG